MKSQLPNLRPLLFLQVQVRLKNSTVFEGVLVGYDAFYNLSLGSASSGGRRFQDVVVLRGQMVECINRQ